MTLEQKQGGEAFQMHQEILENEKARRALLLKNMIAVVTMHDTKLYRDVLGDPEAPWSAYLADVGVFYSRSKIRRWKRIFEFCDLFQINHEIIFTIPESRLEQVALAKQFIKDKAEALELLSKAEQFIPRDWKNEMLSTRGKPTLDDCKHNYKLYELCPDCGEKHPKNAEQLQS